VNRIYTNWKKVYKTRANFIYSFQLSITSTATIFIKLTVAQLHYGENSLPSLTQMVNKCGKYEYKFIFSLMLITTITETIFTKQVSVKKSCTEFHEIHQTIWSLVPGHRWKTMVTTQGALPFFVNVWGLFCFRI
jgi:hypothetical protein